MNRLALKSFRTEMGKLYIACGPNLAQELKTAFENFSMVGKKTKEGYFVRHDNYKKFKFHYSQIKFYWNIAIHLFIAYGCFHAIIAELNSCGRGHVVFKPNLLSGPLQKKYADP